MKPDNTGSFFELLPINSRYRNPFCGSAQTDFTFIIFCPKFCSGQPFFFFRFLEKIFQNPVKPIEWQDIEKEAKRYQIIDTREFLTKAGIDPAKV